MVAMKTEIGFKPQESTRKPIIHECRNRLPSGTSPLFDLGGIDLSNRLWSSDDISKVIPHRSSMALLDWIVWENEFKTQGIALNEIGNDEFWVTGHFPGRPIMPAVLMIEAGAQLACYLVSRRMETPGIGLFLRINRAAFLSKVSPGDQLYILCDVVKSGRCKFVCDLQGFVDDHIAFDAQIVGMYDRDKSGLSSRRKNRIGSNKIH